MPGCTDRTDPRDHDRIVPQKVDEGGSWETRRNHESHVELPAPGRVSKLRFLHHRPAFRPGHRLHPLLPHPRRILQRPLEIRPMKTRLSTRYPSAALPKDYGELCRNILLPRPIRDRAHYRGILAVTDAMAAAILRAPIVILTKKEGRCCRQAPAPTPSAHEAVAHISKFRPAGPDAIKIRQARPWRSLPGGDGCYVMAPESGRSGPSPRSGTVSSDR